MLTDLKCKDPTDAGFTNILRRGYTRVVWEGGEEAVGADSSSTQWLTMLSQLYLSMSGAAVRG